MAGMVPGGFDPNRPGSAPGAPAQPTIFNPAAATPQQQQPQPAQEYPPGEKPDSLKGYRGPNFMGVVRPPLSSTSSRPASEPAPQQQQQQPGFDPTAFFKAGPAPAAAAGPGAPPAMAGPPTAGPTAGPPPAGGPPQPGQAPPQSTPAPGFGFASAHAPAGGGPPVGGPPVGGPPVGGPPVGGPPVGGPPTGAAGPPQAGVQQQQQQQQPMVGYQQAPGPVPTQAYQPTPAMYAAPSQQGFGTPLPAPQKLNSSDMPRPALTEEDDGAPKVWRTQKGGANHRLPPSSLSKFVVVDEGNCSPRCLRTTMNQLPANSDLLASSNLPAGVIIQPLAVGQGEEPIPVVDHGLEGPLRCSRCRAYMNPYMTFVKGGQFFKCNLCNITCEVPSWYYAQTDGTGQRYDMNQRPELCKGSVEFVCGAKEYFTRPAAAPGLVFLLDTSPFAVQSGFLHYSALAVKDAIAELVQSNPEARVGLCTYASGVQFFNLRQGASQPILFNVGDLDDMFSPLPASECVVPVMEFQWNIDIVLDALPGITNAEPYTGHAFGSALKGASSMLEGLGGKVIAFSSSITTKGPGALQQRDNPQLYGTDKEKSLFVCADKFYKELGQQCVEEAVGVDMYICTAQAGQYVDLATTTTVSRCTGGQVHLFNAWNAVSDGMKLRKEVVGCATRDFGFDGMMKMRCSKGMRLGRYLGHFHQKNMQTMDVPVVDNYTTFAATIIYEGTVGEGTNEAYVQFACLYTTRAGQRRVRVHNLALPVSTSLSNVFKAADLDAVMSLAARKAADQALQMPLSAVRDQLVSSCVNALYSYRKFCATSSQSGQLILPEPLKLFPLYTLALMKSAAFRHDTTLRTDERIFSMGLFNVLPPDQLLGVLYPRMYALHNLSPGVGQTNSTGQTILPKSVSLSSENLNSEGAFLMTDGLMMFLWLGSSINPNFLRDVFNVDHIENVNYEQLGWATFDTELSKQVTNLVVALSEGYCFYPKLRILKKSDAHEARFFSYLLEDKSHQSLSYVDFLVHIHRQIQLKFNS